MCLHNESSGWGGISHGVPQGSILGPLFCLYVNGLPSCISDSKVLLFADETSLQFNSPSITDIHMNLQQDLNSICTWKILR